MTDQLGTSCSRRRIRRCDSRNTTVRAAASETTANRLPEIVNGECAQGAFRERNTFPRGSGKLSLASSSLQAVLRANPAKIHVTSRYEALHRTADGLGFGTHLRRVPLPGHTVTGMTIEVDGMPWEPRPEATASTAGPSAHGTAQAVEPWVLEDRAGEYEAALGICG